MLRLARTDSWRELKMWAADRQKWQMRVQAVRSDAKVAITPSVFVPESVLSFTINLIIISAKI